MDSRKKRSFSDEELGRLEGELLPERALMSLVPVMTGPRKNAQVFYACQYTRQEGTPGILGTGILAQGASSSTTCVPGVVVVR
ncbi:hypothetical protein [Actinomadura parmotrematis]|uniref:Uncharacterized protein n=1 Tax=Actinomadura parmotrematis TaxID=2864039 RepID=A0ABS7FP77_9ACTN|nr:hypothetical protein [Actinomadura parmotrematis]MBW8482204.1 hypothetical protein [Actinomadura parmotrematis]